MLSTRVTVCLAACCLALSLPLPAWGDTCLWTGAGANNLWGTAANWANCHGGGTPLNGDSLSFPDGAQRPVNQNNLVGLSLFSITITGESNLNDGYIITGNALTITGNITFDSNIAGARISNNLTLPNGAIFTNNGSLPVLLSGTLNKSALLTVNTVSGNINLEGAISGTGGLSKNGVNTLFLGGANTYTGVSFINNGIVLARNATALGATSAGNHTVIAATGTLGLDFSTTLAEPVTVSGGTLRLSFTTTGTFAGPVTTVADSVIDVPGSGVMTISAAVSGTGRFTKRGSGTAVLSGTGTLPGLTIEDGKAVINGGYGAVPISLAGGTLGGGGQVGEVSGTSGDVSPGQSPGILTTGDTTLSSGIPLTMELNGATAGVGYDQLNVLGSVTLNDAPLVATLGFVPPAGTSFTIVSNDGVDPVDGIFAGLLEGAQFTIGSTPFSISYRGGDGNDIVLTTPPALFTRYFAEGASNSFFATRVAVVNPNASAANVTLRLLGQNGAQTTIARVVGANQRTTFELAPPVPLPDAVFSTVVESDRPVVADRLMSWDGTGYGSTLETAIEAPGLTWYLAEGATGSVFSLYYLIQNPGDALATVTVSYLLPAPHPPITKHYDVPAHSRFTIDVAAEHPDLVAAEVSAKITSTKPIVVERAMYSSANGQFQGAGHDGAAQPSTAARWFLAEGATGFFDEFVLIANAEASDAAITVTYLPEGAPSFTESFAVPANSRYTLDVKRQPALASVPVSVVVESTNLVPVVVERVMWWPSGQPWYEASLSAGVTNTGTKWAIAEGERGGPFNSATYVLIANTGVANGNATVTLLYEDGTSESAPVALPASRRTTVDTGSFASSANRRFGVIVQTDVPVVVERSFFSTPNGQPFMAAGATSVATNLAPTP